MIVYLLMTIISIFFISMATYFYKQQDKIYSYQNQKFILLKRLDYRTLISIVLAFLPMFLVSALRYDVGTDYYYVYTPHYYDIMNGDFSVFGEKPFVYMTYLLTRLSIHSQWLFVFTSGIYIVFMALAIIKISNNWTISLLVLILDAYFFSSMNNIRQNVAVAIIAYAYYFAINKKYIHMSILVLFATCFHMVAIIALPTLFLISLDKIKKIKHIEIIYLVILLLPVAVIPVLRFLLKNTKFIRYLITEEGGRPVFPYIAKYGFDFIFFYIFRKKLEKNKYYKSAMLLICSTSAVSLTSLITKNTEATLRITCYTNWITIFLIPMILEVEDDKYRYSKYIYLISLLMVSFGFTFKLIIYEGWFEILPYQSIFMKK